jgi:hypothetical protein
MALPTVYNHHSQFSKGILKQILEKFKDLTLKTVIRQNVKLKEAAQQGCPISAYAPDSFGAEDYQKLAIEIIQMGEPEFVLPGSGLKEDEKIEESSIISTIQPEAGSESSVEKIVVMVQPPHHPGEDSNEAGSRRSERASDSGSA